MIRGTHSETKAEATRTQIARKKKHKKVTAMTTLRRKQKRLVLKKQKEANNEDNSISEEEATDCQETETQKTARTKTHEVGRD